MFAISKEINSGYSPSFSSNMLEPAPLIKLAPKELIAISQEISREFSPEVSIHSPAFDVPDKPVQGTLRASQQENKRQSVAELDDKGTGLVTQIKFAPNELAAISQEISRTFMPQFSTKLSEPSAPIRFAANELLEISQEISKEFAAGEAMQRPDLIILPVDPYHLHAYWHVDEHIGETGAETGFEDALTLRVYAQAGANTDRAQPDSWFDLAIEGFQSHQKVSLPTALADTVYSAAIGKCYADNRFSVFAYSNITHPAGGSAEPYGYISRAQELSVCKNASGIGK